jgi:hypothetical protein
MKRSDDRREQRGQFVIFFIRRRPIRGVRAVLVELFADARGLAHAAHRHADHRGARTERAVATHVGSEEDLLARVNHANRDGDTGLEPALEHATANRVAGLQRTVGGDVTEANE